MKEFKKDLNTANELRTVGKNKEALEIFEKCYKDHPEEFSFIQKNDYAWAIYKTRIAFSKSEEELLENAEFITQLISQRDFNRYNSCVYTSSIFKVLNHFKDEKDFRSMIPWLEKLDPDLLDEKPYRRYGRLNKSHKQAYYDWASRAYLQNMDFEKCIEVSKTALNTLKRFLDEGDIWLKWRMAKSLIEIGRLREGLDYYEEVIKVKHDWYMYRDIAEAYLRLGKPWVSTDYLCPAILSNEPNRTKANLYLLCYRVFERSNMPMAIRHAELYCLLRQEDSYPLPHDIEQLDLDVSGLNRVQLEREIRELWIRYKFKNQKQSHGTVIRFNHDRNYGFIRMENDDEIFFHGSEFEGSEIFIGQVVSFYTEENYDKVKNEKSAKAVNVRGE